MSDGQRRPFIYVKACRILATFGIAVICAGFLVYEILNTREAVHAKQSRTNLNLIGLALHNYHDSHAVFPPGGVVGSDGTLYHSWMTMLLQYYDGSPFHNPIRFDHPWDDPVNASYFELPVPIYRNPSVTAATDSRGFALSHYAANSHLFGDNSSMKLPEITDGTAQTIMAGEEAGNYTAWGYPRNWRDPAAGINDGPDTFGRPTGDGAIFVFADGHTQFITNSIDPKILRALSTPAGGEPLSEGFQERRANQ